MNISLGWKGLLGTNTPAYYKTSWTTALKSFKTLTPCLKMHQFGQMHLFLPHPHRCRKGWPGFIVIYLDFFISNFVVKYNRVLDSLTLFRLVYYLNVQPKLH